MLLRCRAKINLALAVAPPLGAEAGPRQGFHPICSLFAPVELGDDLLLERLAPGTPSRFNIAWADDAPVPSPIDWPLEKDLMVRAHAALERHTQKPLPVAATLRKRTPVGGGLGGGSADAAAMFRGLDALFALALPEPTLHALAQTLGSDLAFFIDAACPPTDAPRPALVTGLGEEIRRLERVPGAAVLIFPPFGCPTGAVYQSFDAALPPRFRQDEVFALAERAVRTGRYESDGLFNDLAAPAMRVRPALAELRRAAADRLARPVHVTGSGSTLFALAATLPEASAMAEALSGLGCPVLATALA
jgi:4-diphosphocytidyl-2-C-methyl-D-erythritol kinase